MENSKEKKTICVIGLGYVGLPLAVAFSDHFKTIGFDINVKRVSELQNFQDHTNEISKAKLESTLSNNLFLTTDATLIKDADIIIVTVPTPVDELNRPDITPLIQASRTVGKHLKRGAIVVYESTVYPGCTERDCLPILQESSQMNCPNDFSIGYSPERINPGDKEHTVSKIVKVVSGYDQKTLDCVAEVYGTIITAGIHKASSIKVAEAAKVIENTQRDINIALMNELKIIFDKADIPWKDVLEASKTKWNFLPFTPGLVGGHCIGVDPYYLAQEAVRLGHHPEIILAGRRINDFMAEYETQRIVRAMIEKGIVIKGAKVLICGATFKPNVPDFRNSKVEEIVKKLKSFECEITICEPFCTLNTLFNVPVIACKKVDVKSFDFSIKAVKHSDFSDLVCNYELF